MGREYNTHGANKCLLRSSQRTDSLTYLNTGTEQDCRCGPRLCWESVRRRTNDRQFLWTVLYRGRTSPQVLYVWTL